MGVTRASEPAITKVYLRKKKEGLEVILFEEHIEEEGAIKKEPHLCHPSCCRVPGFIHGKYAMQKLKIRRTWDTVQSNPWKDDFSPFE